MPPPHPSKDLCGHLSPSTTFWEVMRAMLLKNDKKVLVRCWGAAAAKEQIQSTLHKPSALDTDINTV